ncbi:MAG: hypothetical protein A6F71_01955 [Cycloclasticus sp. symbiont of Poecilosclerida sp. M]|nr:MAG: hypothetical protein A6F71_01955 [Cycloclasticus sp. symbiont of Poecilosclerida sp. M]
MILFISKQKDFSTLIDAFSIVQKSINNTKLLILGEGDEHASLQLQINELQLEDDVQLCDFVENPLSYMAKSDLFVLSSLIEGTPNVLLEAMACGCKIISTDSLGGSSELLHHGIYAGLVPMKDHQTLVATIMAVYSEKITNGQDFALQQSQKKSLNNYISSCFPNYQ